MRISVRRPSAQDAPHVAALSARLYPERAESADHWSEPAEGEPHWVAVAPDHGGVVGYGCARPEPGWRPEGYRLHLGVAPGWRRQGVGSLLFGQVTADLWELETQAVRARVRTPAPEPEGQSLSDQTLAFLEHRSFQRLERMLFLAQDLAALGDLTDEPVRRAEAAGITFTTLRQELERNPSALQEIHALYTATTADIPTAMRGIGPVAFEAYARLLQDPLLLPDCFFLARVGDRYVGTSYAATLPAEPGVLGHRYTGVLREYRRRHIALALKHLVTRYARENGYQRVTTATLEENRGMRAVNEALGFTVAYAQVRLQRLL